MVVGWLDWQSHSRYVCIRVYSLPAHALNSTNLPATDWRYSEAAVKWCGCVLVWFCVCWVVKSLVGKIWNRIYHQGFYHLGQPKYVTTSQGSHLTAYMITTILFFCVFQNNYFPKFTDTNLHHRMKFCHIAFTMRCLEAGESPLLSVLCQWYLFILLKSNLVWTSTKIQQLRRQLYLNKTCLLTSHSFGKSLRVFRFYVGVFYSTPKNVLVSWKEVRKLLSSLVAIFSFPVLWLEFHHHHLTYHSLSAKVDLD